MFVDTGGNSEYIGIENNIFGRKTDGIDQQVVCPFANRNLAFVGIGLTGFVESHDDYSRAVSPAEFCLTQKFGFSGFQGNRIDDGFSLKTFQTGFDHFPF